MHVSAVLKNKGSTIITTQPDETIGAVTRLLAANRIGAVLVIGPDGAIGGILSERDIVRGLAEYGPRILDMPVSRLMTSKVVSCHPDDTVASVMSKMTEGRFRHLPVMEGNRLVGLISIGDVVKHRLEEYTQEVESLREYVAGRT